MECLVLSKFLCALRRMGKLKRILSCLHNPTFHWEVWDVQGKICEMRLEKNPGHKWHKWEQSLFIAPGALTEEKGHRPSFCIWFPACSINVALEDFVEGSAMGPAKTESSSLTDISGFTWSNNNWNAIELHVLSCTACYTDMQRDWGLSGEAVGDSGVERTRIQSFPHCLHTHYLPFSTHVLSTVWGAAYKSLLLFLTSGTAGEIRAKNDQIFATRKGSHQWESQNRKP